MKYVDIELLAKEIDSLYDKWCGSTTGLEVAEEGASISTAESIFEEVRKIIASLQYEQHENKPDLRKSLKEYFEKTPKEQLDADWEKLKVWNEVGPDVETYCKAQREQLKVDLENEIERFFPESYFETTINFEDVVNIAHHFAEWGAEHLKK